MIFFSNIGNPLTNIPVMHFKNISNKKKASKKTFSQFHYHSFNYWIIIIKKLIKWLRRNNKFKELKMKIKNINYHKANAYILFPILDLLEK